MWGNGVQPPLEKTKLEINSILKNMTKSWSQQLSFLLIWWKKCYDVSCNRNFSYILNLLYVLIHDVSYNLYFISLFMTSDVICILLSTSFYDFNCTIRQHLLEHACACAINMHDYWTEIDICTADTLSCTY